MSNTALPPDNPGRHITIANAAKNTSLPRVQLVGDLYTIMIAGIETDGKYCLIDMVVPPGGGPGPHRHNFEEMFSVLEGEVVVHFRDSVIAVAAGETVNIPANAPHYFRNESRETAHLLCMCSPPGQEEFFLELGLPVPFGNAPPAALDEQQRKSQIEKAAAIAWKYNTQILESLG